MMGRDAMVLAVCAAGVGFVVGLGYNKPDTTVCREQPGAELAYTVQDSDGTTCHYIDNIRGRAKPRRAS
jgi:hypothetical protein